MVRMGLEVGVALFELSRLTMCSPTQIGVMGILQVAARCFLRTARRKETRRQFVGKRLVVHKAVCLGRADRLIVMSHGIERAAFDPGDLRAHEGRAVPEILRASTCPHLELSLM